MTDNRTTELRAKLTERGIEYQAIGKRLTYWNRDGSKNDCDDADFVADEQNGYLIVEGLTPEQAIAATLGGEKPYYTDRDDNGNHINCAQCGEYLGTAEEFAAMAGEKRCFATDYTHERCKYSVDRGWVEDAELGSGTCEDVGSAATFKCSECGWYSPVFTFGEEMPRFCPQCGKAVER